MLEFLLFIILASVRIEQGDGAKGFTSMVSPGASSGNSGGAQAAAGSRIGGQK
jgi:hypothetical protein